MSSSSVFLIPTEYKGSPKEFALQAKFILERLGVIDGFYDKDLGWFAAGENSFLLFKDFDGQCNIAFEFAIIYGSEAYRMVPDTGIHGFRCPICGIQIDDDVIDAVNSFYDAEEDMPKRDMRFIRIRCHSCKTEGTLGGIPCDQESLFTNMYINFDDVWCTIDNERLRQLEGELGSPLQLIYERY